MACNGTAFWAAGWRPFASLAPLTFLATGGGKIDCLSAQRDARRSLRRNPWIALGLAAELVLIDVPGVGAIFAMAAIAPVWLLALPIAAEKRHRRSAAEPERELPWHPYVEDAGVAQNVRY